MHNGIGVTDGGTGGTRTPHFFSFTARERRGGVGRRSFVPPNFRSKVTPMHNGRLQTIKFSRYSEKVSIFTELTPNISLYIHLLVVYAHRLRRIFPIHVAYA
jgi:hypothetical protein